MQNLKNFPDLVRLEFLSGLDGLSEREFKVYQIRSVLVQQ